MKTQVLIIGAGPYGISLSHELHLRKIPHLIVGHPFSLWFNHTFSNMQMRSDEYASEIYAKDNRFSCSRFLKENYKKDFSKKRIPIGVFREYLHWVLQSASFPLIEEKILFLDENHNEFIAETDKGTKIYAQKVVVAVGIENHRQIPDCLKDLHPKVFHSWFVKDAESWRDKKILIVGSGQSAAEAILLLSSKNDVTWAHRSPLKFFAEPTNLPRPLFHLILKCSSNLCYFPGLIKLIEKRFISATITPDLSESLLSIHVKRIQKDARELDLSIKNDAVYSGYLKQEFDQVLACTGYHYSLDSFQFMSNLLARMVQKEGIPHLNRDFSTSIPNLFMVGGIAEPYFGPAQRFILGCQDATIRVGKVL